MADKKKMSVADILAAARKADTQGDGASAAEESESAPAAPDAASSDAGATAAKPAAAPKPAQKVPASGAGRPSVADILAMARAKKEEGASASTPPKESPKPAPKPAAAKAAPAKPAAKTAPQKSAAPVDTQSILAAARKATQPGPLSKAEAARLSDKAKPAAPAAPAASKARQAIVVPPMPVKPEYAKAPAERTPAEIAERRSFFLGLSALATGFVALAGTTALWAFGTVRFMFPNVLREPPSRFRVGFPDQFAPGQVETKFKAQYGVWVVNTQYNGEQQLVALRSVCTHLGCTPNWLEAEQKFKCPCHGSGFYKDGINFEGPAPRPLERHAIAIADDGQVEIDRSRLFQEEMGQWSNPASFIPV